MHRPWQALVAASVVAASAITGCVDDDVQGGPPASSEHLADVGHSHESGGSAHPPAAEHAARSAPAHAGGSNRVITDQAERRPPTGGDLAGWREMAYCAAALALESVGLPGIEVEHATPEQVPDALRGFLTVDVLPLVEQVALLAAEGYEDRAVLLAAAAAEAAITGDLAPLEDPDVVEAAAMLHGHNLDACGWVSLDVAAGDVGFKGLPTELGAGPTSFEFVNVGAHGHELALLRKADGVTASAEQLLSMPPDDAASMLHVVGRTGAIRPGGSTHLVADLEPGDRLVLWLVPVGVGTMDGPSHVAAGMVAEATVR